MKVYYNNHPEDSKKYDTSTLRERYLIETMFEEDQLTLNYSHHDRIIVAGAYPVNQSVTLPTNKALGTDYFLERREVGLINIGGAGKIVIDGETYEMAPQDGMYIGQGFKEVSFTSIDPKSPAKYYINSAPAHKSYPIKHIPFKNAKPNKWGEKATLNERTIYQYVHPDVCDSCQLVMGMTLLSPGSVWNTMPTHTHERRMEVYFYFDMAKDTKVFHLMGEAEETRHIVMSNEQAIISPSWSIHSGVGTSNYTFIWGMCGENKTFTDMDFIDMSKLK